jgi:hypothetical protein
MKCQSLTQLQVVVAVLVIWVRSGVTAFGLVDHPIAADTVVYLDGSWDVRCSLLHLHSIIDSVRGTRLCCLLILVIDPLNKPAQHLAIGTVCPFFLFRKVCR